MPDSWEVSTDFWNIPIVYFKYNRALKTLRFECENRKPIGPALISVCRIPMKLCPLQFRESDRRTPFGLAASFD